MALFWFKISFDEQDGVAPTPEAAQDLVEEALRNHGLESCRVELATRPTEPWSYTRPLEADE